MNRVTAALPLILAALLAGCDESDPKIPPGKATVAPTEANAANVRNLCDFVAYRSLETMATSGAEGNVKLLADRPGIPETLRSAALSFYRGGLTSDVPKHRAELGRRYAAVLEACRAAGTGWQRP